MASKAAAAASRSPGAGRRARGFTLVEVLVAMMMMALLATITWQGLDSILRARDGSRAALDRTQRLATVVVQWEQDLQALHETRAVPALHFDGRIVRMTRRTEAGVALVAWSVRSGQWQRWMAPATTRLADLQEAWLASQALLGNEPGHLTLADNAGEWQIYFHRGGAWTNAQSTGDVAMAPVAPTGPGVRGTAVVETLPAAVRLVITLGGQTLTRDIALGPSGG